MIPHFRMQISSILIMCIERSNRKLFVGDKSVYLEIAAIAFLQFEVGELAH